MPCFKGKRQSSKDLAEDLRDLDLQPVHLLLTEASTQTLL